MAGGVDAWLVGPDGKPLLTHITPWGTTLLTVEPSRVVGFFKAVTNSGVQIQTIVSCGAECALFVTDIVVTATKKAGATVVVRFHDGTNTENIVVLDVNERGNYIAIHPQGRTLGWDDAAIQLVTDTAGQDATCTVWYNVVHGDSVLSYAKWNATRSL
ncbi:MAG: hypothetical protein KAJ19_25815 [Gammaproteobacteria bacterium]|nr:hypothetical protein [Gammaproteobacteria bacterium]